ncbi:AAA family ATPase [Nostoc sp. B(2019)]|nr:AAA family ATPase [Nostoc sp. B(2019)]
MNSQQNIDLAVHTSAIPTEGLQGESDTPLEKNVIVTKLSEEAQLKLEVIQSLMEPCDRTTYGQKLREAAEELGVSLRTVQRLVKNWEQDGLVGLTQTGRANKGKHRIGEFWEKFITKTYKEGNKGSKRMTPKQVALRVEAKALELKDSKPPNYRTVLRVLAPILEKQEKAKSIRSPGWRGTTLSVKTREGKDLSVDYSNHVWQCDHTRVDVLLVDQHGELLSRPWLTTVIDTYSRCIMGIYLGFDAPSSGLVALALRHAILPKQYGSEYKLHCEWGTYGKPEHFYTDGGSKDLFKEMIEYLKFRATKGTVSDFRGRAMEVLKGCGVEMLIIDEADRLKPETFAEVRDIYDKLGIAVVLVGTDRLEAVIKRDEQVYNRFRACHRFGKLSGKDFQDTVQAWEDRVLKLPVSSNLNSKDMLRILTSATEGYIGRLDEILREAAIRSLSKGFKKIDKAVLQEVAKEYK